MSIALWGFPIKLLQAESNKRRASAPQLQRLSWIFCYAVASLCMPSLGTDLDDARQFLRDGKPVEANILLSELSTPSPEQHFQALLLRARSALMIRDADQAGLLFEQAAAQFGERPEAEIGQVSAYLLSGEFRKAVAYANLVAGEHSDHPTPMALLALIEDRAGNTETAMVRLRASVTRWPDAISPLGAMTEIMIDRGTAAQAVPVLESWLATHWEAPDILRLRARAALALDDQATLRQWRLRTAHAFAAIGETALARKFLSWSSSQDDALPASKPIRDHESLDRWSAPEFEPWPTTSLQRSNVGNGVVVDRGQRIITDLALAPNLGARALVRNGLGTIRSGRVERRDESRGVAVLLLDQAFDETHSIKSTQIKDAKAGAFCFGLGFPVVADVDGGYPVLSQGIVVRTGMGSSKMMQVTSWFSRDQRGAPVFDSVGNLIGIYRGKDDQVEAAKKDGLGKGSFAANVNTVLDAKANDVSTHALTPQRATDDLYQELLPAVVAVVFDQ